MTLPRLKSLLVAWASEKSLHQLVLSDECLLDHFFRYLEETYGCGHLAAHVAHACIMAFDEYVVSTYSDDSCRLLNCGEVRLQASYHFQHDNRNSLGYWVSDWGSPAQVSPSSCRHHH